MEAKGGLAGGVNAEAGGAGIVYTAIAGASLITIANDPAMTVAQRTGLDMSVATSIDTMTIDDEARVRLDNAQAMIIGDLTITATGSIDHSGLGYAGGIGLNNGGAPATDPTGAGPPSGVPQGLVLCQRRK